MALTSVAQSVLLDSTAQLSTAQHRMLCGSCAHPVACPVLPPHTEAPNPFSTAATAASGSVSARTQGTAATSEAAAASVRGSAAGRAAWAAPAGGRTAGRPPAPPRAALQARGAGGLWRAAAPEWCPTAGPAATRSTAAASGGGAGRATRTAGEHSWRCTWSLLGLCMRPSKFACITCMQALRPACCPDCCACARPGANSCNLVHACPICTLLPTLCSQGGQLRGRAGRAVQDVNAGGPGPAGRSPHQPYALERCRICSAEDSTGRATPVAEALTEGPRGGREW